MEIGRKEEGWKAHDRSDPNRTILIFLSSLFMAASPPPSGEPIYHFWDGHVNKFTSSPMTSGHPGAPTATTTTGEEPWFGDVGAGGLLSLPVEMVVNVVSLLHPRDIAVLAPTCRTMKVLCTSDVVWEPINRTMRKHVLGDGESEDQHPTPEVVMADPQLTPLPAANSPSVPQTTKAPKRGKIPKSLMTSGPRTSWRTMCARLAHWQCNRRCTKLGQAMSRSSTGSNVNSEVARLKAILGRLENSGTLPPYIV